MVCVFFQMMKGATDEQRKEWKMPHGQRFVWLPKAEKHVEGSSLIWRRTLDFFSFIYLDFEVLRVTAFFL